MNETSLQTDEDCSSTFESFKRWFLVSSNWTFMLIPAYAIKIIYMKKLKIWTLSPEILMPILTTVISSLYHKCDLNLYCNQFCVLDWGILYRLDFIVSYQMVPLAAAYTVDPYLSKYKIGFHIICFTSNIIFVLVYKTKGDYDDIWYGVLIAVSLIAIFVRLGTLFKLTDANINPNRYCFCYCSWFERFQLSDAHIVQLKHDFDLKSAIIAICAAVIGFFFKFYTPILEPFYWWMHSLWHISIALAIFFLFNMYDIYTSLCWRKKQCNCQQCRNINLIVGGGSDIA